MREGEVWRARLPWPSRAELGTFPTEREAEERLAAALSALGRARVARAHLPLSDYLRAFLELRAVERLRDVETDRSRVAHHVTRDAIGAIPIACLDVETCRAWLARLLLKGGGGRGERRRGKLLSAKTVRNVVVLVRVALERAVQESVLVENPLRFVRVPRSARATTDEGWTVLDASEQRVLLAEIGKEGSEVAAMVAVALGVGIRRGELLNLHWQDVFLDGDAPHLVVRYGTSGGPTKGGRPRRVPLFGIALDALRKWRSGHQVSTSSPGEDSARAKVARAKVDKSTTLEVFGRVFQRHTLKVPCPAFRRALVRAGIARAVRWHDLRHTCATSLLEGWWGRAWTVEEVRQLLGHRSSATTERYLHARGSLVFRAAKEAAKVGAFWRDALKTDGGSSVR